MTDLRNYMQEHRDGWDNFLPEDGDTQRFLAKAAGQRSRRRIYWLTVPAAAAAAIAAVLLLRTPAPAPAPEAVTVSPMDNFLASLSDEQVNMLDMLSLEDIPEYYY